MRCQLQIEISSLKETTLLLSWGSLFDPDLKNADCILYRATCKRLIYCYRRSLIKRSLIVTVRLFFCSLLFLSLTCNIDNIIRIFLRTRLIRPDHVFLVEWFFVKSIAHDEFFFFSFCVWLTRTSFTVLIY